MTRSKLASQTSQIDAIIQRAGSIGALERLAGIGASHDDRVAFWTPFCKLPGAQSLDAGVAELKRRIRAQAQEMKSPPQTRRRRNA